MSLIAAAAATSDVIINNAGFLPDWLDPVNIIQWLNTSDVFGGIALVEIGVLAIIFAETGLLIGFFLPGDSILFTVGMFYGHAASRDTFTLPFWLMILLIFLAAFIGDQVGYFIGHKSGPHIFNKPDSRLFKKEYVDKTYSYFERFGGRTVVLARFVPIVRTFAPVAAGVGKMHYRTFIFYNLFGALLWGVGVTTLGYLLGGIQWVGDNIEYIFIGIVLVSIIPIFVELIKGARKASKNGDDDAADGADAPSQPGDNSQAMSNAERNARVVPRPLDSAPPHLKAQYTGPQESPQKQKKPQKEFNDVTLTRRVRILDLQPDDDGGDNPPR